MSPHSLRNWGDRFKATSSRILRILMAAYFVCATPVVIAAEGSTDVFLRGSYLDVGINSYGTLGSQDNAPVGFHARSSSLYPWSTDGTDRLGITYDNEHNGWGVGRDIGDLMMAASPSEGYALQVGPDAAWNNGSGVWDLGPGTFSSSTTNNALWMLNTHYHGLQLTQKFLIPDGSSQLFVYMILKNISTSAVNDVYLTRCIDPDLIEPEEPGMLTTTNGIIGTVEEQGYAAAWSESPDELLPAELGMWSYDTSAHAHIDCSSPSEDYLGLGTQQFDFIPGDTNIGITKLFSTIAPGEEVTFTIGYGMSRAAIVVPPPILPSTSMSPLATLFGATLRSLALVFLAMFAYWVAEKILAEDF